MSSVTKDPEVSSILLFSGSGINFTRPMYISSLKQIRTRCGDRPGNEKKSEKRYRRKNGRQERTEGNKFGRQELKRERHVRAALREAREGGTLGRHVREEREEGT
jgi:hypothetical protein